MLLLVFPCSPGMPGHRPVADPPSTQYALAVGLLLNWLARPESHNSKIAIG